MNKPLAMLILTTPLFCGCTTEMAYRSAQSAAEQQCLRQPPPEVARCQERIYRGDYPTYEKNRPKD